jgi:phosphate transport system protein
MVSSVTNEIEELKKNLQAMASLVEEAIHNAIGSLSKRDSKLAQQVIAGDDEIDRLDNLIDEMCLKLLDTKKPTGPDLRFLTMAMKIGTDLERMSDHAVNVAYRAISLNEEPQLKPYMDLPRMGEIVESMARDTIKAFLSRDVDLAHSVHERDNLVDALDDQIFRELITYTVNGPTAVPRAVHLAIVSRSLERIADHATNIAEDTIFIETGEVLKHLSKPREMSLERSDTLTLLKTHSHR